jgi:hypothetical protein
VYNVTPHAVGIIVYKIVGNRYIEKRVNIRVEHVKHSKCRQEFLDRVQANHAAHVKAKETGGASYLLFVQSVYVLRCASDRARLAPPRAGPSPRLAYRLHR